MRKTLFLFILLLTALHLSAQRRNQIQLTSSQKVKGVGTTSAARFIRPVFTHEGSTLSADSADYNQAGNAFDAYGHVVITQPNGTVIHSDLLNYDGNSRVAILTNNVRMIDRESVLTTNYLTYNLGTRMGTYIGGGKIENGQNVLTSKNGYYFGSTQDAYFRYDVVVNTPDALITTDTLKYNTVSKIAWFFGPTRIHGKGKNKESKLYTENGRYNTVTDQAWFGKKNLYTEGSKSLKGDSLFYDGKAGFGKAIHNITFRDTADNDIVLRGNQGIYYKKDESALVTRNAYVVMEAEQDSAKVDSIWMTADTLLTKLIPLKSLTPVAKEELKADQEISTDPTVEGEGVVVETQAPAPPPPARNMPRQPQGGKRKKSAPAPDKPDTKAIPPEKGEVVVEVPLPEIKDSLPVSRDSLKRPVTPAHDTVLTSKRYELVPAPSSSNATHKDSLMKDSLSKTPTANPSDTASTRVIFAFHKVKIFKSDLQSRSDSAFYSYADSIIRCYKNPIIWTQGSQLTADTIYLQMKNRKLDNMLLQHNGFVVSTEGDSTKFNQVKGKVLTGIFENSKLKSMFVDGNAESIYYSVEDSAYTGMNRSLSSRMRLEFADNKLQRVMLVRKPEGKYYPIEKVPKDIEILPGFIWKPKDRPKSKEEIIPGLRKQAPARKMSAKPAPKTAAKGKTAVHPSSLPDKVQAGTKNATNDSTVRK